jgi:hypothetical protein
MSVVGKLCLNDFKHADYFPTFFADNHKSGTGPYDCDDCVSDGVIDGVFMGYCGSCAKKYKGYRGPGMTDYSVDENRLFFTRKVSLVPERKSYNSCKIFTIVFLVCIFVKLII